jgi:hypothetical protein
MLFSMLFNRSRFLLSFIHVLPKIINHEDFDSEEIPTASNDQLNYGQVYRALIGCLNLETAVGSRKSAQVLDAPDKF